MSYVRHLAFIFQKQTIKQTKKQKQERLTQILRVRKNSHSEVPKQTSELRCKNQQKGLNDGFDNIKPNGTVTFQRLDC